MKLQEALRHTVLNLAQREGWIHPTVCVTTSRKQDKATINIAISGTEDMDVNGVLRRELDALRDLQSEEASAAWPEITIHAMVMMGATWTGTTVVTIGRARPLAGGVLIMATRTVCPTSATLSMICRPRVMACVPATSARNTSGTTWKRSPRMSSPPLMSFSATARRWRN